MRSYGIALGALLIAAYCSPSLADDVRSPNVPEKLRGTWATSTDLCSQQPKTLTLSDKHFADAQSACDVAWVQERAGTPGTIYSAHMLCRAAGETSGPPKQTNLLMWLRESGEVSIGPAFNALVPHVRCP